MGDVVATKEMCFFCFDTLYNHFDKSHGIVKPNFPNHNSPLFVTWNIERHRDLELRGCIGNFGGGPLHSMLEEYALTSSLRDRRFNPVSRSELPTLHCAVSLLTQFQDVNHCYDWEIGTHGIIIKFEADGRRYNGTYLPEVCPEQGWTKEECVESLIRKAGYRGRVSEQLLQGIQTETYISSKISASHEEYLQWREQS